MESDGGNSNCLTQCRATASEMARQWCGTDHHTYPACDWSCKQVPAGVGVYPGACQEDGSPQPDGPPEPADGDRICDWVQVGTSWEAVECSEDLNNIPEMQSRVGGGNGTHFSQASPATLPMEVDHRSRYGAIKNQGSAGTCTAFATTAAMEGAVRSATGVRIILSEMHLWARYHESSTPAAAAAARRGGLATTEAADTAGMSYDAALATRWAKNQAMPDATTLMDLDRGGQFQVDSVDQIQPP